ncbi:MAG: hypothetical protein ABIR24_08835 [Verrucomicrobiota bacterium]
MLTETASELLEFLDGSTLHGRLRAIDSDKGLRWEHPAAKQPIDFKPENIAWIRFPNANESAVPSSEPSCKFQFVNGDEFFGNFISLNENELELQTWFGGKFKTPRAMVRSIRFFPKGATPIYEGPTSLAGWNAGAPPNPQAWKYEDGAFIASGAGTIGRDLKLPDASRLEFDLAWSASFNLLFAYYTAGLTGFNYNSSSYMFYITPGNISLQRITAGTGSSTLGRSETIPAMLTKKKIHLEFRGNKEENFLEVLVDGKLVNQWKDTAGWVGKGSGVLFYSQNEGSIKISNIKASEWDGKPGSEIATNAPSSEDQIHLANRDKVSGKVATLRDGNLKFTSATTVLEIPLQRISQIIFGGAATNPIVRAPWEIQASVSGGGTISFALEKWNNEQVSGQNRNFGKIALNSKSIRQIRFNLDQSKASDETISPDNVIWEADEK